MPHFDFSSDELHDVSWEACLSVQESNKIALIQQLQDEIAQRIYHVPYDELPTLAASDLVREAARGYYDTQEREILEGRL